MFYKYWYFIGAELPNFSILFFLSYYLLILKQVLEKLIKILYNNIEQKTLEICELLNYNISEQNVLLCVSVYRGLALCDGILRTMSGGEPSSIKRAFLCAAASLPPVYQSAQGTLCSD